MKRWVVSVAVAVVAVVAGVSAGLLSQSATTIPNQKFGLLPASPQLSTRIALSRTHVVAGSPIKGFVVVTNRGKPLKLWDHSGSLECTPSYGVTLTNNRFPPDMGFEMDCRPHPLVIASGVTRLPVSVFTTYQECSPTTASKSVPKCLPGLRMPPLPSGQYKAVLVGVGLRLPAPKAVSVTLTVGVGTASTAAFSSHGTLPPFGRVLGQLVRVGGPSTTSAAVGIPGRVVFSPVGTSGTFTYPTARNGTFVAIVPGGFTYRVTGYSPKVFDNGREELCAAGHRVRVPSWVESNWPIVARGVEVVCSIK